MEWKNRDGSGTYQSRYIIDLEKGNIIITGDCGNAIACFSNQLKVEQLSGLVSDIGYFAEKIRCGECMFTYEPEDIEADLGFRTAIQDAARRSAVFLLMPDALSETCAKAI